MHSKYIRYLFVATCAMKYATAYDVIYAALYKVIYACCYHCEINIAGLHCICAIFVHWCDLSRLKHEVHDKLLLLRRAWTQDAS